MASVLVVDDDPASARFARRHLAPHGHRVHAAADGPAAWAAVHKDPPDVVLLDVGLGGLDGWGVLERLKRDADDRISTARVVVLTAAPSEDDRLRAGIDGALAYLAKPVAPAELVDAVRQVLEGGPEPAQRHAVQRRSLARLAALQRGEAAGPELSRVRFSRLERARDPRVVNRTVGAAAPIPGELTARQRALLQSVRATRTVSAAAAELGTSRSNVYATLRRISRTLDVPDVATLVRLARAGALDV